MNDYGDKRQAQRAYRIDAYDFNGKSANDAPTQGTYADNIMDDPSGMNEGDNADLLIQLQGILNDECDLDDDAIARAPRLSASAIGKLGIRFGMGAPKVQKLFLDLVNSLVADKRHVNEAMDDIDTPRYSMEEDSMGNMIISDAVTGKSMTLMDQDAHEVKEKIEAGDDNEQEILHDTMHGDSNLKESDDGFGSDTSTYNFPWRLAGKHGTATGKFSGSGDSFQMKVISVRDETGEEIDASAPMMSRLTQIGMDFINHA